jgi:hypothetical protein
MYDTRTLRQSIPKEVFLGVDVARSPISGGVEASPSVVDAMSNDPRPDQRPPARRPDVPSLTDEARRHIGDKLRRLYEELEAEPIPDKFVDLLRALAEKESKAR